MLLASVISPVTDSPTPRHSDSINYSLISLNILFDSGEDTLPSCSVDKLLGALLLILLHSLPCVVLFNSHVPVNLDLNYLTFSK